MIEPDRNVSIEREVWPLLERGWEVTACVALDSCAPLQPAALPALSLTR